LRVPESPNKFDNTDIHPDQYELAEYIIPHSVSPKGREVEQFFKENKEELQNIYPDV